MREIVGFVMGAAAGAAGALFATSTEGRALIERLRDEARPETERAATEWEPVLREVGRAVRLAAKELETATADLRSRIGEIAAALPAEAPVEAGGLAGAAPDVVADAAPDVLADAAPDVVADATTELSAAAPAGTLAADAVAEPRPDEAPVVDEPTPGA